MAKVINAPLEAVVFVPNATTGVNTVLRNLEWNLDGKDEIIYFPYGIFFTNLFSIAIYQRS